MFYSSQIFKVRSVSMAGSFLFIVTAILAITFSQQSLANLSLVGVFKNKAVILVDGEQVLLKVGQAEKRGVRLLRVSSEQAVVEYRGERKTLPLSKRISTQYRAAPKKSVAIQSQGGPGYKRYVTSATINGKTVRVLVDTGATSVAMNKAHAKSIGIDYKKGEVVPVSTAGGMTSAYIVKLNKVEVGGIVVHNVEAGVTDGDFPTTILLGMSYLTHVKIEEEQGVLYLRQR